MKISTVREFRDHATEVFHSKDPVLVTRHGQLAGIFFPHPEESLPLEMKKELYKILSAQVARQFKERGMTEEELVQDFEAWRKKRRETRRRR